MSSRFRKLASAWFATPVAVAAIMFAASAPASAQTAPTAQYCSKQIPGDIAWKNFTQSFSCVTIEAQTFVTTVWACVPSPTCTPGVPTYLVRARRTTVPNIMLARAAVINAIGPPTCVLQPTSTAWTPWTVCARGAAPPQRLRLDGIWGSSVFP